MAISKLVMGKAFANKIAVIFGMKQGAASVGSISVVIDMDNLDDNRVEFDALCDLLSIKNEKITGLEVDAPFDDVVSISVSYFHTVGAVEVSCDSDKERVFVEAEEQLDRMPKPAGH